MTLTGYPDPDHDGPPERVDLDLRDPEDPDLAEEIREHIVEMRRQAESADKMLARMGEKNQADFRAGTLQMTSADYVERMKRKAWIEGARDVLRDEAQRMEAIVLAVEDALR